METMSETMTTQAIPAYEAADLLQVTPQSVYNALRDGRLKPAPGGVARASVIAWLRRDIEKHQRKLAQLELSLEHLTTNATAE
jgi:hypothetical protein